jgi:hypothetical protein
MRVGPLRGSAGRPCRQRNFRSLCGASAFRGCGTFVCCGALLVFEVGVLACFAEEGTADFSGNITRMRTWNCRADYKFRLSEALSLAWRDVPL